MGDIWHSPYKGKCPKRHWAQNRQPLRGLAASLSAPRPLRNVPLVGGMNNAGRTPAIDLNKWHHALHQVTGDMAGKYNRATAADLERWAKMLRDVAGEMDAVCVEARSPIADGG